MSAFPQADPGATAPGDASGKTIRVDVGARSYDIVVGSGLLGDPRTYASLPADAVALVVSNATVAPLFADRLVEGLRGRFRSVGLVTLDDGEAHKTWAAVERIIDALLGVGADRKALLFALGGGVVGDVTGFAAACYMRGIAYVQVPTTLLAQVDSSVGGKTAINHPRGKNMVGAFHQPSLVVADLDTLRTLPQRELAAGLAEVIKSAIVADAQFFDWIEAHMSALLARDETALAHVVRRSCEIKARIVANDERESGVRAVLNFGHTFGHAIEVGSGYGVWLHGEAVASGMAMALDLSVGLGLVDPALAERAVNLIASAGLPVRGPALGVDRYLALMRGDKKSEGGEVRFVVVEALGRASLRPADPKLVASVLRGRTG